jgi:pterin-4a-carbinolamine dehydratase
MSEKKVSGSKNGAVMSLKAERVQEELTAPTAASAAGVQDRLKAERVQLRLKQMPGWGLALKGPAIDRVREFQHEEDAVDYATLALRMASRERYPVRVQIAGKSILLTLHDHPRQGVRGGITDKLMDFASSLG